MMCSSNFPAPRLSHRIQRGFSLPAGSSSSCSLLTISSRPSPLKSATPNECSEPYRKLWGSSCLTHDSPLPSGVREPGASDAPTQLAGTPLRYKADAHEVPITNQATGRILQVSKKLFISLQTD